MSVVEIKKSRKIRYLKPGQYCSTAENSRRMQGHAIAWSGPDGLASGSAPDPRRWDRLEDWGDSGKSALGCLIVRVP